MNLELSTNPQIINELKFIELFTVPEYQNIDEFKERDPFSYASWHRLIESRFHDIKDENDIYLMYGSNYPEFSKIAGFSFGSFKLNDDQYDKDIRLSINEDEREVMIMLCKILDFIYSRSEVLASYSVRNYMMPFISRRYTKHMGNLTYRDKDDIEYIARFPKIFMANLRAKPWERTLVDIQEIWGFGSVTGAPAESAAYFLGVEDKPADKKQLVNAYLKVKQNTGDTQAVVGKILNRITENTMNMYLKLRELF
jgi:hypothetical protein